MKPRLIHKVDVEITRVDLTATRAAEDPEFKEPIGGTKYEATPVKFKGQIHYSRYRALNMTPGGDSPISSGHITIEKETEKATGGFNKGDKITKIAGDTVEFYVIENKPAGFYSGEATLKMILFESRGKG
jgi:hypothetical protein